MCQTIREKYAELFGIWIQRPDFNNILVNCNVPRKIMLDLYKYSLTDGLTPIEKLPTEKKRELFNAAKEISPGSDNEFLTTVSRILWLKENL